MKEFAISALFLGNRIAVGWYSPRYFMYVFSG